MKKKNLSKLGIKVIRELDEKEKRFISNYIADNLRERYSYLKFSYLDIVFILYNTNMYIAESPDNMSSVNYIYQNQSLYFSEDNDIFDIDEFTLHECIHRIQDRRNKKGKLMQLGNCEFTDTKVKGLVFNEAAIQYIVSSLLKKPKRKVRSCNIVVNTMSETYYPLISNLIEQIVLLLDEKQLVQSTICANNDFNYQVIDALGEKEFFVLRENFDKIQDLQNKATLKNRDENIKKIRQVFYQSQKIIYENYFGRMLDYINNVSEIERTRQKLDVYSKLISCSENFDEFQLFYDKTNKDLDKLEAEVKSKYALIKVNRGFWNKFSLKIKNLFNTDSSNEYLK